MDYILLFLFTILFFLINIFIKYNKRKYTKMRFYLYSFLIIVILLLLININKKVKSKFTGSKNQYGGNSEKLLNQCGLPNPEQYDGISHCFNDSTHHTCCMLGPEAKKYANGEWAIDRHGKKIKAKPDEINPIGTVSDEAYYAKTGKKAGKTPTPWCTCFGSKVCSYYSKKFDDGTHIKFISNPNEANQIVDLEGVDSMSSSNCEDFIRDKFNVASHGTPGVNNNIEYNSNNCGKFMKNLKNV